MIAPTPFVKRHRNVSKCGERSSGPDSTLVLTSPTLGRENQEDGNYYGRFIFNMGICNFLLLPAFSLWFDGVNTFEMLSLLVVSLFLSPSPFNSINRQFLTTSFNITSSTHILGETVHNHVTKCIITYQSSQVLFSNDVNDICQFIPPKRLQNPIPEHFLHNAISKLYEKHLQSSISTIYKSLLNFYNQNVRFQQELSFEQCVQCQGQGNCPLLYIEMDMRLT